MSRKHPSPAERSRPAVTPLVAPIAPPETKPYFCNYPFTSPVKPEEFVTSKPTHPFVDALATSDRSYIVAAPTGAGKSSLLRASLCRALVHMGESTIMVADPKAEKWSGLERLPSVVHYLTEPMGSKLDLDPEQLDKLPAGTHEDHMEVLYWAWCIKQTWEELQRRIKQSTPHRRKGTEPPKSPPWILIIDEHFGCYAKYEKMPPNVRKALQLTGVMGWLSDIVVKGRASGVRCVLISQSHLCGELGFSSSVRKSFGVMVLGRVDKDKNMGDLSMVTAAIIDRYLIPSAQARDSLLHLFNGLQKRGAANLGMPVALNVMGVHPRIGILPNLMPVDAIAVGKAYLGFHPEASPKNEQPSPTGDSSGGALKERDQAIAEILRVARSLKQPVIKANNVKQYARTPTKLMDADAIRGLFRAIADMRMGTLVGEGAGLGLSIKTENES